MDAHFDLTPGAECVADGRIYQIDRVVTSSSVSVRDKATGEVRTLRVSALQPMVRKTRDARKDLSTISDADWNRASALADAFTPTLASPRCPLLTMRRIARQHGLSLRHVQRLRRSYLISRSVSSLAPVRGGKAVRENRLDEEIVRVITFVINKHYLKRERPPMTEIVDRAGALCRRLGLPAPSRKAVVLRIRRIPESTRDRQRLGAKAANQLHQSRGGRLLAHRPLELIQIDHTKVDVMVVSDDRQQVLGRPWISLAIDVHTRCVMGMYLSMDAPSSVSVSLCIDHAVLPKSENDEPGNENIWPMYGKPERILTDNGKDFRADALERGCREHGIALEFRPVKTPHYGAHIERLNGTLMRACHLLSGTKFSNIRDRGDYNSEKKATFTLSELRRWLVNRIGRHYHVKRHRCIGMPPAIKWEVAWTDAEGNPKLPPLVASPLDFRMDFLPVELRKVTPSGFVIKNSRYHHAELRPLIRQREPTEIHYDPRAPQIAWARLPDGGFLEVPAVAGPAIGEHEVSLRLDAETQARMLEAMDRGFEEADAIEANARKAQRRAKRHGNGTATTPPPPPEVEDSSQALAPPPPIPSITTRLTVERWTTPRSTS